MSITRGKRSEQLQQHQRVYDRLRKRSLRKKEAYAQSMMMWDDAVADAIFEDRCRFYGLIANQGNDVAHMAYVRGVRDALVAIEAQ